MFYSEKNFNSTLSPIKQNQNCEQTQRIIHYLNTIIPLLWVIIGTITNSLALVVFSRRSMRRNSTFIYLAIMSFSDIVTIWTSSFRDYLAYKFNIYINGDYACKMHTFLFFTFAQFSSWLLVGANLDRLVCVISLNKYSKLWCTKRTAIKFALILFSILTFTNFHFLIFIESKKSSTQTIIFNELRNFSQFQISSHQIESLTQIVTVHPYVYPQCTLKHFSNYILFYSNIYTWIDSCVYCLLPFIIMLICNITLIKRVFTTKRNLYLKQSTKAKYSILSLFKPKIEHNHKFKKKMSYNMSTTNNGYSYQPNNLTHANDSIERMRNMAITIIGVTILFIIFTVPINIYIPITLAISSGSSSTSANDAKTSMLNLTSIFSNNTFENLESEKGEECQDLLFSILNNMVNANHSINFFIYYMTNSKFNKEFKILMITINKYILDCLHIPARRDRLVFFPSATSTLNQNFTTSNNNTANLINGSNNDTNNRIYLNSNSCKTTLYSLSNSSTSKTTQVNKSPKHVVCDNIVSNVISNKNNNSSCI